MIMFQNNTHSSELLMGSVEEPLAICHSLLQLCGLNSSNPRGLPASTYMDIILIQEPEIHTLSRLQATLLCMQDDRMRNAAVKSH